MSQQVRDSARKTSPCPRCKALNGQDFTHCVRCGHALSSSAQVLQHLGTYFDGDGMWGSKFLILITVLVFAGQVWVGQMHSHQSGLSALMRPTTSDAVRFGALLSGTVLQEPWRLISAVFVHFGTWHLLSNMLFLTWLGRAAEPAIGSARFVTAYIVTGIAGFVASVGYGALFEDGGGLTAGASGAVFGVTGMVLGLLFRQKNPQWKTFAVQAVLFQLLVGFAINQSRVGILINNLAHLGGLVAGMLFGVAFATRKKSTREPSRTEFLLNVGALIGLLVCVGSLVLAQKSFLWRLMETFSGEG